MSNSHHLPSPPPHSDPASVPEDLEHYLQEKGLHDLFIRLVEKVLVRACPHRPPSLPLGWLGARMSASRVAVHVARRN
jgi:hypothetical protein